MEDIKGILSFIKEAEGLKNITRTAWTSMGRQESTAEHTWRLTLLAMVVEGYFPKADMLKVMKMCIIHDLGEVYEGDVSAKLTSNDGDKYNREEKAMKKITEGLPDENREELLNLWYEYNECQTEEARLVKALDKLETIVQHNQGVNPEDFDYEFNLGYGKKYFEYSEFLKGIRALIDEDTASRI